MSGTTEVLHATIRATDESSSTLADIAAHVRKLEADTRGLRQETHRTAEATRELAKTAKGFGELNAQVAELTKGFGEWRKTGNELFPMFGKLAAAGSVIGLFEVTHQVAEAVGQSAALAKQLQISTAQVKGLKLAAAELDVPFETVTKGVGVLTKVLKATELGKNKDAAHILQLMGISLKKANGEYKTAAELLPEIAESISKTQNEATKGNVALGLFGKSGMAMLPFLEAGREELEKFQALAKKFATNLSSEQIEALERYKNAWIELDMSVGMLKTTIGAELAPVLAPVVEQVRDWAMAFSRSEAQTHRLRSAVKDVIEALEAFPWKATIADIEGFVKEINTIVESTVGWKTVIEGAGLLLAGKFALSLLSPIGNIGKLGLELLKLAGLWGKVEEAAVAAGAAEAAAAAKSVLPAAAAAAPAAGAAVAGAEAAGTAAALEVGIARRLGRAALGGAGAAAFGAARAVPQLAGPAIIAGLFATELAPAILKLLGITGNEKNFVKRQPSLYNPLHDPALRENPRGARAPNLAFDPKIDLSWGPKIPILPNLKINPLHDQGVNPWGSNVTGSQTPEPNPWHTWAYDPARYQLAAPAPPVRGQVDVNVKIENLPPGSTVSTTSSGDAQMNTTDVGYNNPSGRGW